MGRDFNQFAPSDTYLRCGRRIDWTFTRTPDREYEDDVRS